VTQWLRGAQVSDDDRQAFYHIPNIGRKKGRLGASKKYGERSSMKAAVENKHG